MEIENVAVLPVPDCAWAMTSLPLTMGFIALCWIAEGFSNPERKKAIIPRKMKSRHKTFNLSCILWERNSTVFLKGILSPEV